MLNQVILMGRLTSTPILKYGKNGVKYTDLILAVAKTGKNEQGMYETDFINIRVDDMTAESVCSYCKKGDVISVRGQVGTNNKITAEKISFLSSR